MSAGHDTRWAVFLAWSYDSDGNEPTQIGQKIGAVTVTAAAPGGTPCTATETFAHDASGQLVAVALTVSGPASAQGATAYAYNNLGELVQLTLPAGSPLAQVCYTQDDQGLIAAIGSSETSGADIAASTCTTDGLVETEMLGAGAWVRAVQYASPGWVEQVATTSADAPAGPDHGLHLQFRRHGVTRQITYGPLTSTTRAWAKAFPSGGSRFRRRIRESATSWQIYTRFPFSAASRPRGIDLGLRWRDQGRARAISSSGMPAPPIEKATYCLPPAKYVIGAPPAFAGRSISARRRPLALSYA